MDQSLKGLLERHPTSHLIFSDRLNTLWSDGETTAGVYLPLRGAGFILAEESIFHPMRVNRWEERYKVSPFETEGTQWLVDLGDMTYCSRPIHYAQGAIQGLVYALEEIRQGGPLPAGQYEEFIVGEAREMAEQVEAGVLNSEELDEAISARLMSLGFFGQAIEAQR
jgi:hypothetical protein